MNAQAISFFGQMLRRYRAAANLSQEELAERAHLSARAISDLERGVKRAPRKETVELLANALALSPQKRALFVSSARPALAPPPTPEPLRLVGGDLTTPLTPLLGRERELLAASKLLARQDVRLMTITGPGGVGKTRFALFLAEELADDFEDGVYVAPLAPLRDAALVAPLIARVIGLREEPGVAHVEQVTTHLRDRQVLLILDNIEHLMDSVNVVRALLTGCPRLRVIVTSRQPLRIRGEQEFPLAPLALDAAMRLFIDRVRAVRPLDSVSDEKGAVIRQICERLDCLPLALELAAVRARALPLRALLQRLDSALTLLTAGWRDLPERQQTLRGAIAWSVDLLDERERRVFRALAVFAGGCSFAAAQAVCGDDGGDPSALFDRLAGLVERSLLQIDASDEADPRFAMLETIRAYAAETLCAVGEEPQARERHASYFAALAEQSHSDPDRDAQDRGLLRDMDNFRAAIRWAIEMRRPAVGMRIASQLSRLWYMQGYMSEGEAWLSALLELDAQESEQAIPSLRLEILYGASRFAMDRRDYARAQMLAEESREVARQLGSASGLANALATLGHVAEARENYAEAATLFESSLDYSEQANDIEAMGRATSSLGNLARMRGDYQQAITCLEVSLGIASTLGMSWGILNALGSLGHISCEQGDYERAAERYRNCLTMSQSLPNEANVAWLLEGVVVVLAARGDYEQVARLHAAIVQLRHESDIPGQRAWPPYARAVATARQALERGAWERATSITEVWAPTTAAAAGLEALA